MISTTRIAPLTHQIRLYLFEMGLSLTPLQIDFFISKARRETLKKLSHAAMSEGLMDNIGKTYCPLSYLANMKNIVEKKQQSARFWAWEQLALELEESMTNLALSLAYRYEWDERLKKTAAGSLWQWTQEALSTSERTLFFEQWGAEGHPYHPNGKAKMGMSQREVLQYSPEFQSGFKMEWLAIDKRFAKASALDFQRMIDGAFPMQMAEWRESLRRKNKIPAHYLPIPVHPWQCQHTLGTLFKEQLDENLILRVGCEQQVRPTLSFRTVVSGQPLAPHIKLATAVHTTSAMRTVSPASVHNGPRLSHLLKMILAKENHFNKRLYVLYDKGGVHADHTKGKHLSALFRDNPNLHVAHNETAVVVAALFSRSPITHKPLLIEIIDESGLTPEAYFKRYCECLLPGQMTLYLKYGLALESHQQNTLMVFDEKNLPVRQLNRDLGGIRVMLQSLKKQGYILSLDASVAIVTDDENELRHKFIHSNLQSHLAYVIDAMVLHCQGVKAETLWGIVRDIMAPLLEEMRPLLGEKRYQQEKKGLMSAPWELKSLLRMRLEPCHGQYLYRKSHNPLNLSL
jgi:siderophore synthetase component